MLQGSYNFSLVLVSLGVAVLASFVAFGLVGRVRAASGSAAVYWLGGGAFAMGLGIWSMHFVGMLAFSLPIAVGYDIGLTAASLGIAVLCSAYALWTVCRSQLTTQRLLSAGLLMGSGIAAMHYVGMTAMLMAPGIDYSPVLFTLSVVVAIVASIAALWILFHLRPKHPRAFVYRILASLVMGTAIVGMHYTGMAAAQFPVGSICMAAHAGISAGWLAAAVTTVTMGVLGVALVVAVLDNRLEERTSTLSQSLAEANQELVQLALHDTLTRLPNRILLEERLQQSIEHAGRAGTPFSVLFMDLDGFKAVNDAYGHHAGDALLVELASRLRGAIGPDDSVARLWGDEFVVVSQHGDPLGAAGLAQRLIDVLSVPVHALGHQFSVSASVGIAMYPNDGRKARVLLASADAAMYHAKRMGRGDYSFFEAEMKSSAQAELSLVQALRMARERNEFVLHYQPKFEAPDGPVHGVEALLRWQRPEGMLMTDCFIPAAERTGLIVPIGEWVLDEACRQMREWHDLGHSTWTVSVNLSALQFAHPQLVPVVRDTLQRHNLPAESLILEITETIAMRDAEVSLGVLRQLRDLGVSISIDDFGTGYSSLLYLKRLPATELKIDRGFVMQLERDNEDAAIVSAIIALGQKLKLRVVAEGVETADQQAFLTDLGCDSLQGYFLGRPVSADVLIGKHPGSVAV